MYFTWPWPFAKVGTWNIEALGQVHRWAPETERPHELYCYSRYNFLKRYFSKT